jgi:DNA-binding NtrC family response regulator/glycine cleavage system H lipoate-binding protein
MSTAPKLLVVDDERVVCDSCSRIFQEQGFQVETSMDSQEGLQRACGEEYAAILLDIMIPGMDGLEFLERLRQKNRSVPVIMITGYSSIPSASAAMRLGAADYIPKPFSPDEIIQAVNRLLPRADPSTPETSQPEPLSSAAPWIAASGILHFGDEAWIQEGTNGNVRVGTVLSKSEVNSIEEARMPRIGEMVFRGLPLMAFSLGDGSQRIISSPLTGEVLEVNPALQDRPALAFEDPCRDGWIACIRPTRLADDLRTCRPRTLVLASTDDLRSRKEGRALTHLGCRVLTAWSVEGVLERLHDSQASVLLVDAATFGDQGPVLVEAVGTALPDVKIVILADRQTRREAYYRGNRIFYFAVEPFADHEIADILQVAFLRRLGPQTTTRPPVGLPKWVRKICVINQRGERISLLTSRGVMQESSGVGRQLIRAIQSRAMPIQVTLGYGALSPTELQQEIDLSQRVVVIEAVDSGRLQGSLQRGPGTGRVPEPAAERVVVLSIQPGRSESGTMALDMRTTEALVEHILREMI